MRCPACGAASPPGARFCPSCGFSLVAVPDERRVATVLFADLVGFTTLSETTDPEQVKNLCDRIFAALSADVTAFGGRVDKIVGDAMLALFGAPVAHEDDAERAVRAALQMMATLAELRREHDVAAELRIGINTGEVVVGAPHGGGEYTAMGDVVNTANRLESAAPPGHIYVGATTHEATHHAIRYEVLGPLRVRGRGEPVVAWRAIDVVAPPGQRRRHTRTPLIGRDPEMRHLRGVLEAAISRRRAHLVLLTGDAGVGKSRLASELASSAQGEYGAKVLSGHCVPYGGDVWSPIAEVIRSACGIDADASAVDAREKLRHTVTAHAPDTVVSGDIERVVNGLLYLLGHIGDLSDVDPGRARDDSARALRILLQHFARERPLVLVLSDLHWADDLVLGLVERLLVRLRTLPFVFVATARPELDARWKPEHGRQNITIVSVDPLDLPAVENLVYALFGGRARPELARALYEHSGGNPFFVEELAALIREAGNADGAELPSGALPVTLQGLVAARLDTLGVDARDVLEDCAVVGSSGSAETVIALGEPRRDRVTTAALLRALADRELIDLADGEYSFISEVIREVAYATLTKAERARRHAQLTSSLESRDDDEPGALDRAAHHYGMAAELVHELGAVQGIDAEFHTRALRAIERAAARAREAEIWGTAGRLYDRALAVLPQDAPEMTRLHLLLGRARANAEQRHLAAARQDLAAVLEAAEDEPRIAAQARSLLGQVEQMEGHYDTAVEIFDDAIAVFHELGDERSEAEARRGRGRVAMFRGDLNRAESDLKDALALYRAVGDRRGEAWALQTLATIAFFAGDADRAEDQLLRAHATFQELRDYGGLNWSLAVLAWVRYMQGRLEDAANLAREQLSESEALGNRWVTGILRMLMANVALWSGRPEHAIDDARAAIEIMVTLGDPWGQSQARAVLARALAASGELEMALKAAHESIPGAEHSTRQANAANAVGGIMRAQILAHAGEPEALAAALHAVGLAPDTSFSLELRNVLGRALLLAGRVPEAVAELEAVATAVRTADTGPGAANRAALALAYVAAGRVTEAAALAAAGATYLDRVQCAIAGAFAGLRLDAPGAEAAFDVPVKLADETEARLDQAVARLARACGLEALRSSRAVAAREEADRHLTQLGLGASGWRTLFALAANSTITSS